jgi:PKD repeat protein
MFRTRTIPGAALAGVLLLLAAPASAALFAPPVPYPTGQNAVFIAVADFNNDGKLDLAVSGGGSTVAILLGNGDGTFQLFGNVPVAGAQNPIAAADLNHDGNVDLIVTTIAPLTFVNQVTVLLGNGDGTFRAQTDFPVGNVPVTSVTTADVNGDGNLDVVVGVSNLNSPPGGWVGVLLGDGTGALGPATFTLAGPNSNSTVDARVGDFNGDGAPDIVAVNQGSNDVGILLNNGNGTFQTGVEYSTASQGPDAVTIADFNGDGKLDLAVANQNGLSPLISILLGNGDGTFQPAVTFPSNLPQGTIASYLAAADFNGDGKMDLVVVNNGFNLDILLGNGDGTFGAPQNFAAGNNPFFPAVGDFNGDGQPDIVVSNQGNNVVNVLINGCIPPTGTVSGGGAICAGQSSTIQCALTGTPPWTVTWSDNVVDTVNTSPDVRTVSPAATTTYTVLSIVDATGCGTTNVPGNAVVTVNAIPAPPAASNNGPICAGQTLQLSASNIAGATYDWTGPNGFTSALQNPSIPNVTVAASGTYSVTATVSGCTSAAATTTATVNATPAAPIASNNGPICQGQTLQLTASTIAGAAYNWTGPNGFTSPLQNPSIPNATVAASGTYNVTATVGGCTSAAGTTAATVNAGPAPPAASNNGPICAGQTLQLSATTIAGAAYSWTGPNGFASTAQNPSIPSATVAASGTYSVTATVAGCTSAAATTNATVNAGPSPPVASNNSPVCVGTTLQLTASAVAGATYSWTGPSGFTSTLQNPSIPNVTAAATGVYSVTASVAGCVSAAATTSVVVDPGPSAVITAPSSVVAGSGGHVASVPDAGAGAGYNWSITNGSITSGQNTRVIVFSAGVAGVMTLDVTVLDPSYCSASSSRTITVTSAGGGCTLNCTATAPTEGTAGFPVFFVATSTATTACGGSSSYTWDFGDATSSTEQFPAHAYVNPGSYTWTLTVNHPGASPCRRSGTILIGAAVPGCALNCEVSVPSTAAAGAAVLFASLATPSAACSGTPDYLWDFGDGYTSVQQNPSHTYSSAGVYSWRLTVTLSGAATCVRTGSIVVIAGGGGCSVGCETTAPTAASTADAIAFTATASPSGECFGGLEYQWDFGDGTTSTDQNPTHTYATPGIYTWTETTSLGGLVVCSQTGTILITAGACAPPLSPLNLTVQPIGNPEGPLTVTDYLVLGWQPDSTGTPPSHYEYWINGEDPISTTDTFAIAPPRGDDHTPITLFVQAFACDPEESSPIAQSATYSLDPPVAAFSISPNPATVGQPVTLTDTSQPEATGWLWVYDDGTTDFNVQAPTHTFATAGSHQIALVASNGSGSSVKLQNLNVNAPAGLPQAVAPAAVRLAFGQTRPFRQGLEGVRLAEPGTTWLHLTSSETAEVLAYLRIEDSSGHLLAERRLSILPGREAVFDVGAYGQHGIFNLALVSIKPVRASLTITERIPPALVGGRP